MLVLLPVVFGKGRSEAQNFSWLVEHEQNIPGGSKGEIAERGMGAGKREIEKLWLGQEKEDEGVLRGTKNLAVRTVGTGARLHHPHGRLAVNCLSRVKGQKL